jgi:hypothetical protein
MIKFSKIYSKRRGIHYISEDINGWLFLIRKTEESKFIVYSSEGCMRENLIKIGTFYSFEKAKRFAVETIINRQE